MVYPFFLFFRFVQLFTVFFIFLSIPLKFSVQKMETLTTAGGAVLSDRYVTVQTKFVLTLPAGKIKLNITCFEI